MTVIGLTGKIGSGKSLAATYLAELGAAVIDADKVGHEVIAKGRPAYVDILAAFPGDFLDMAGEIDRKKLGSYIFADTTGEARRKLNSITHGRISEDISALVASYIEQGKRNIVIEAALLLECELKDYVEQIWVVIAPKHMILSRVHNRDGLSDQVATARFDAQLSVEEQMAMADMVIVNDGTIEQFKEKLAAAYAAFNG